MYESYYGLDAKPFRLTPDPRMLYVSSGHKRALSYLRYGIYRAEGFVTVLGPPGTGKTSLVQTVIAEISEGEIVVAKIVTTQLNADDALRAFAASVGLEHEGLTKAGLLNRIEKFLREQLTQHKRVLLLVDEAQHLSREALEELRMLTNFQEGEHALMQCFLIGQEELREVLCRDDMEQLQQRIIASCNLRLLTQEETVEYIEHRLTHCGWNGEAVFSPESYELIYQYTRGNPRRINDLCERLMLRGYLDECYLLNADVTFDVIEEIETDRGNSDVLVELREFKKSLTGARRALKLAGKTAPIAAAFVADEVAAEPVAEKIEDDKSLYAFPELPEDFVDEGEFAMPAAEDVLPQDEALVDDVDSSSEPSSDDVDDKLEASVSEDAEDKEESSAEAVENESLDVIPSDLSEAEAEEVREAVESSATENTNEADAFTFPTTSDEYQASFFENEKGQDESGESSELVDETKLPELTEEELAAEAAQGGLFDVEDEAKLEAEGAAEDEMLSSPDNISEASETENSADEEPTPAQEDSSEEGLFDAEDEALLSKENTAAEAENETDDSSPQEPASSNKDEFFDEKSLQESGVEATDSEDNFLDAVDEERLLASVAVQLFLAINSEKNIALVPVAENRKVMEMHWRSTVQKEESSSDEIVDQPQSSDDIFAVETKQALEDSYGEKQDDQPDPTPYFGDEKDEAEMPKTDKFYYTPQDKKLEVKSSDDEVILDEPAGWRQYIVKVCIGIVVLVALFIVFLPAPQEPWELELLEQSEMGNEEMMGSKDVLLTNPPISELPD